MNVLPSVRYYNNAIVFFNPSVNNIMTSTEINDAFVHQTFGEEDVVVVLQATDNHLKVKNIFIVKTSMEVRRLYRDGKTDFFFYANPGSQHHSLLLSDLRDSAHLNDFENDQYIADLLQELDAKPHNVFIVQ